MVIDMKRNETKTVFVGDVQIGGQNSVVIQSMTTTRTANTAETINQILDLESLGCQIIRVSVLDETDAKAIEEIVKNIHIPLVADIHFDYRLALLAIEAGAKKIRINPGNIDTDKLKLIVEAAKLHNVVIRVGVNGGSLPEMSNKYSDKAVAIFESAKKCVEMLENLGFFDIVVSLKSSNVLTTVKAYELASAYFPYPLHIGVTEAGDALTSSIRSGAGLGILLNEGIGDTIRISMNDDSRKEVIAAKELLSTMNLFRKQPILVACPTCGRCQIDSFSIVKKVKAYLDTIDSDIKVAIMGCIVNGPGEAKEADIGIAGGNGQAVLFKKGQITAKIAEKDIAEVLIEQIKQLIA